MPADRTVGQVAYEKHAQVFRSGQVTPWGLLRPPLQRRWETIATAVIEACGGSGG